jgi:MarR family transcriptional regulator, 2-MHQ and catechol-resistance regulon repressor
VRGVHIFLVLSRATRAVEARALASIAGTGLCASDFGVLEALLHKGPLPVNALGKKVLLTSGSMTAAVDRLVARRLVARNDDSRDRRVRVVALTPEGRRLIKSAFARHASDLDEVVSVLTETERSTVLALLKRLGQGADDTHEQA